MFSILIGVVNKRAVRLLFASEPVSSDGGVACKHTSSSIPQCGGLEISMPSRTRWGEIQLPIQKATPLS